MGCFMQTQLLDENIAKTGSVVDSKTTNLDDILKEKLENAFHNKTSKVMLHDIAKIAIEHSPIDLAYAASHLPSNARPILFDNLPSYDDKIKFIVNTSADTRLIIFRYIKEQDAKKIFEKMSTSDAVWVLDDMSERRYRRFLELLSLKKAQEIKDQKKHKRNSAGRLMTTEFLSFNKEKTIKEAAEYIHDHPKADFSKGIFITNDELELQGYVPARNIVVNPLSSQLKQVMREVNHKVKAEISREEVIDLFERYKLSYLPVVDDFDKLIGVISQEDVLEAMEDMADETVLKMAGTAEDVSTFEPLLTRFLKRAPWLIVTLLAGLINVGIMSSFQRKEGVFLTFVLFFVPLITGMSGNIGIQCSTVLVRSMAIGLVSKKSKWDAIFKELRTGITTGLVFGVLCGIIVYFLDLVIKINVNPLALSTFVCVGLIGACLTGTFLGVFSPIFFEKVGIDPAIASGPIVAAFNDVLSMTIYFVISYGLSLLFF
ncbi:MAG: magnesium transporter [Parachlamydiales bacterium]|nr:magnesium transporter [Parachlamydiales bacterium]